MDELSQKLTNLAHMIRSGLQTQDSERRTEIVSTEFFSELSAGFQTRS